MIYVFGKQGCTMCVATKSILSKRDIEFVYHDISEVYKDPNLRGLMSLRNKVKKQATKKHGADYLLPLISNNEILITLDDIIKNK